METFKAGCEQLKQLQLPISGSPPPHFCTVYATPIISYLHKYVTPYHPQLHPGIVYNSCQMCEEKVDLKEFLLEIKYEAICGYVMVL